MYVFPVLTSVSENPHLQGSPPFLFLKIKNDKDLFNIQCKRFYLLQKPVKSVKNCLIQKSVRHNFANFLKCMCYMFPEIHLWYNICQPLGGQHSSRADLLNIPLTRHWWGSNLRPIAPEANA